MGLAVSDPLRMTAQPLVTRPGGAVKQMVRTVLDAVFNHESADNPDTRVGTVVIGHPIHLSGEPSDMSRRAEECVRLLRTYFRQHLKRPMQVVLWDERLTSVQAEKMMIEAGASRRLRKHKKDQVAAQLILQGYLDAQRNEHQA
jgi:putative Holliday junction resolvase